MGFEEIASAESAWNWAGEPGKIQYALPTALVSRQGEPELVPRSFLLVRFDETFRFGCHGHVPITRSFYGRRSTTSWPVDRAHRLYINNASRAVTSDIRACSDPTRGGSFAASFSTASGALRSVVQ